MIDGFPLVSLTPSLLLGIVVLLVLTGRLVPRIYLVDKGNESERWRLAYEAEREARQASDEQTRELLEMARTAHAVITSMSDTSERIRRSGAFDAPPKE
jgi:hypothetical protein